MKKIVGIKVETEGIGGSGAVINAMARIDCGDGDHETAVYYMDGDDVNMFVDAGHVYFDGEPEEEYINFGEDGLEDEEYGDVFTKLAMVVASVKSAI